MRHVAPAARAYRFLSLPCFELALSPEVSLLYKRMPAQRCAAETCKKHITVWPPPRRLRYITARRRRLLHAPRDLLHSPTRPRCLLRFLVRRRQRRAWDAAITLNHGSSSNSSNSSSSNSNSSTWRKAIKRSKE